MDSSIVTALSAILGSLVGGSASIATAWITQKTQSRRELVVTEIRKRELLYTEFVDECRSWPLTLWTIRSMTIRRVSTFYALQSRIRLTSSDMVVAAAEQTVRHILKNYFAPNMTTEELRDLTLGQTFDDPLKPFSAACRNELKALQSGA